MSKVLLVTNGHGEDAIGMRIGRELRARGLGVELFPLVGEGPRDATSGAEGIACVGPRATMPSGGIVAFGNVGNLLRDLRAGLPRLVLDQLRFLRAARERYAAAVAVGDVFCLLLALRSRLPVFFVGTAKSVRVAPYGPGEMRVLRAAAAVFVRDEVTAAALRSRGVPAQAPGNVMMDMLEGAPPAAVERPWLALLPGSREAAYEDARFLTRVARDVGQELGMPAMLSLAASLDRNRVAALLKDDGWSIGARAGFAFEGAAGAARLYGWRGRIGSVLAGAALALGQAGTANEQAAGAGVPVVAFEPGGAHRTGWYRMRQQRLLGEALLVVEKDERRARAEITRLLRDQEGRARMGRVGRERMGGPGGAAAIGATVAARIAGGA
ncbi:MAG: lipid-A-disaccharide synthase-related protein [bacterium]|nr:lipid-A-disaccharide synthase-related protein [bacterium]